MRARAIRKGGNKPKAWHERKLRRTLKRARPEAKAEKHQMLAKRKRSARLTSREREMLRLIAEGYSAKKIGSQLKMSPRTVEYHKYHLRDRLKLRSTADLIRYAVKHGIVK